MSNISVDYDVLNQRGSPAWFTDTFANIPTAGYVGRMFISKDTFAFYRDTGTGWDLIGGPGIGTLTGSGVVGQVSFFNGTQVLAGNNNLFWDNTNSRLGINTTTPGQPLDIHSTGNTLVQLNNTTTANSNISFQNQNVAKWRIGNVYNAGANSFDIQNAVLSNTPISIDSASSITTFSTTTNMSALLQTQVGIYLNQGVQANALAPYTAISGIANGLYICPNSGTGYSLIFPTSSSYQYTFPATTGTLALTSNLSAYLPLAGGTLTGALTGTTALFNTSAQIGGSSYNLAKLNVQGLQGTYLLDLTNGTEGNFKLRVYNNGSAAAPGLVFKQGMFFDEVENGLIKYYRGTFGYDGYIALATGGVDRFNISYGGYVGIGNTNTTYNLDITGTLRTSGSSYFATSSGSVGIGNVSPLYNLDVTGTGRFTDKITSTTGNNTTMLENISATTGYLTLARATNTGANLSIWIENSTGGNRAVSSLAYSSGLATYTSTALQLGTNNNIRMTINAGGGVNIGTGSNFTNGLTNGNLDIFSVGLFSYSGQMYQFNNCYHDGSTGFYYKYSGSGVGGSVVENSGNITFVTAPSGTANNPVTLALRMTITQAGNIGAPSGTNIYNASDLRLKKNISTINNGLDKILALNPVKFNWIDGFEPTEDGKDMLGFIAQEVQNIIPESVENFANNSVIVGDIIVDNALRVNEKFIIPVLVKAIQELNEKLIRNNIN